VQSRAPQQEALKYRFINKKVGAKKKMLSISQASVAGALPRLANRRKDN
jgi:hypothetical protein